MHYKIRWNPKDVGDSCTVDTWNEVQEYVRECVEESVEENVQALCEGEDFEVIDEREGGDHDSKGIEMARWTPEIIQDKDDKGRWTAKILGEYRYGNPSFITLVIEQEFDEDDDTDAAFERQHGKHADDPRPASVAELEELWRAVRWPGRSSGADDAAQLYIFLENHGFRVP
jgi:hypothetical protein